MARTLYRPLTNSHVLPAARPSAPTVRLAALLALWRRRIRERAELARLDERALRDVGLTRAEVEAAISKPFWRA